MQPRVDRHRLTFVLLAWLGGATVCFAQDVARMDQVVQSYVSNGTFAGSVLVARGSDVIVSKGYGLANVEWNVPSSPSARFKWRRSRSSSRPPRSSSSKSAGD
jgi:hypothetical protein